MTSSVKECALRARSTHGVNHAIVQVNIVIGVVLGEVLVAHVVPLVVYAVIGLALGLIAHVVVVVYVVAILHGIFLEIFSSHTPSVTVDCVGCYRITLQFCTKLFLRIPRIIGPITVFAGFPDLSVLGPSSR